MFASKTPRDLNRDPYPLRRPGHHVRVSAEGELNQWGTARDPRPEFDHVQRNEPNPILTWHRKTTRKGMSSVAARYTLDNWEATVGFVRDVKIIDCTPEHERHARRVLTRLAALEASDLGL